MSQMKFTLQTNAGDKPIVLDYQNLYCIGYAGRNMEKTMEHIRELEEELGVPAPKKIPTIFQCSNLLLTQEQTFHVVGSKTCGEVEYIIVLDGDNTYIGVGSDHTDRDLESASVPKAKQVCPKPIGPVLWDYNDVKNHMDSILISSRQIVNGQEVIYQEGTLADILSVDIILQELRTRAGDIGNCVIFSGTVPASNGFQYGEKFLCELDDKILGRKITCTYSVTVISEEER